MVVVMVMVVEMPIVLPMIATVVQGRRPAEASDEASAASVEGQSPKQ